MAQCLTRSRYRCTSQTPLRPVGRGVRRGKHQVLSKAKSTGAEAPIAKRIGENRRPFGSEAGPRGDRGPRRGQGRRGASRSDAHARQGGIQGCPSSAKRRPPDRATRPCLVEPRRAGPNKSLLGSDPHLLQRGAKRLPNAVDPLNQRRAARSNAQVKTARAAVSHGEHQRIAALQKAGRDGKQ